MVFIFRGTGPQAEKERSFFVTSIIAPAHPSFLIALTNGQHTNKAVVGLCCCCCCCCVGWVWALGLIRFGKVYFFAEQQTSWLWASGVHRSPLSLFFVPRPHLSLRQTTLGQRDRQTDGQAHPPGSPLHYIYPVCVCLSLSGHPLFLSFFLHGRDPPIQPGHPPAPL